MFIEWEEWEGLVCYATLKQRTCIDNSSGVIFVFLNKNMFWVLIRSALPRQGASDEYPQQVFVEN